MATSGMHLLPNEPKAAHYPTRALGRHFVHVQCEVRTPTGEMTHWSFCTFVAEHSNRWVLVTAGHCLEKINQLTAAGYTLFNWRLDDQVPIGSKHNQFAPPLIWERTNQIHCFDEPSGIDYGLLALPDMHRLQLAANAVIPLTRDSWAPRHRLFGHYFLLGIPEQGINTSQDGRLLHKEIRAMPLRALRPDEVPDVMLEKPWLRHYFQITSGLDDYEPHLSSIEGMSGGPVFAVKEVGGELRYWVIGVQSTWDPTTRKIAACSTNRLHHILQNWLETID